MSARQIMTPDLAAPVPVAAGEVVALPCVRGSRSPGSCRDQLPSLYRARRRGIASAVLKTTPLSKAHTLTKVWIKLATPLAADATIRVRNDSGTELYAGVLVAGQTELISGVLAIVTTNMKLLFSIDPGVVTLTLEEARFGWTRKLS